MLSHRRLIGILGGMGPAATVDFLSKIVTATGAALDQDHVPLIVHHVPQIPDRSAAILSGSDAPFLPMLAGIRLLEQAGVDVIAIPCNTAHFWHERLSRACRPTIIHIADAVAETLRNTQGGTGRVALMATRGTIAAGIYSMGLAGSVDGVIVPDDEIQDLTDRTIALVKAGALAEAMKTGQEAAHRLLDRGADRLLLACTELPVALAASPLADRTVDATLALAEACVRASLTHALPNRPADLQPMRLEA